MVSILKMSLEDVESGPTVHPFYLEPDDTVRLFGLGKTIYQKAGKRDAENVRKGSLYGMSLRGWLGLSEIDEVERLLGLPPSSLEVLYIDKRIPSNREVVRYLAEKHFIFAWGGLVGGKYGAYLTFDYAFTGNMLPLEDDGWFVEGKPLPEELGKRLNIEVKHFSSNPACVSMLDGSPFMEGIVTARKGVAELGYMYGYRVAELCLKLSREELDAIYIAKFGSQYTLKYYGLRKLENGEIVMGVY